MKIVKFFCLLSLIAIVASALAEDAIVNTPFFNKYLDESVEKTNHTLINPAEIPAEVMQSFMQSPFKDLSIQEARKIEEAIPLNMPVWMKNFTPVKSQETLYVLSLTDNISNSVKAVISFNYKGKLLNVEKI